MLPGSCRAFSRCLRAGATSPSEQLLHWQRSSWRISAGGEAIFWQVLGIFDLVTAVTTGTTARWIHPNEVATTPMTVLPLSLIPTFAVPLFLMLHIICIAQARQWKAGEHSHVGEQLHASAS
jgi:hypothetical protein